MRQEFLKIRQNRPLTKDVMEMKLQGNISDLRCGSFINIRIDGLFLRRPISVCNIENDELTIVYKIVGKGTEKLSLMKDETLDVLVGLGNGYDTSRCQGTALLIGGGVGVPPLYYLSRKLKTEGKKVKVILGFNTKGELFYEDEFRKVADEVIVTTVDGSYGIRGFVTDALSGIDYDYVYTCGPEAMLKAVYKGIKTSGQFSFEERMGCGFGACMGCSCRTIYGNKRICKDGPVLVKEEILWQTQE